MKTMLNPKTKLIEKKKVFVSLFLRLPKKEIKKLTQKRKKKKKKKNFVRGK